MPVSTTSFKAGTGLEAAVLCHKHGLSYFKHIESTLHDLKNSQDQPHEQACSVEVMRKLITTIQEQLPCQRFWQAEIMVSVIKHIAVSTKEGKSDNLSVFLDNGLSEILVFVYEETKRHVSKAGRDDGHEADCLMEVLYETINEVCEYSGAARKLMVEAFCARLIKLVINIKILFHTRMEAERTLNLMLEGCDDDDLSWVGNDPVIAKLMQHLAELLPVAGDFEMQIAMTESLARMVTKSERRKRSTAWFPLPAISEAFLAIDDQQFDSDCRLFLNLLNQSCRERSVYSFPCMKALLGDFELRNPNEDKVSEFWVDFNAVSQSITMYVADEDTGLEEDGGLWETVTFPKQKVQEYLVNESDKGFISLVITLTEPASSILAFCGNDSRTATITFNPRTDLADALDLSIGLEKNAAPVETPSSSRRSSVSKINVLVNRARNTSWGLSNMPQSFNDGYIDGGVHHELHSGKHARTSGDLHANEAKATPMRRKISIPLVPMITPTRTSLHSAASSSVSFGGVACQGKQKIQGFGQPKTPTGLHGSTKKVKTPLQVTVADKPSSSGTDSDHPKPQSRTPAKVSVTRNSVVCQSPMVIQEETERTTPKVVSNPQESASSHCDGIQQEVAVQKKTRKGKGGAAAAAKKDQAVISSSAKSTRQKKEVNDAGKSLKDNEQKGQLKKGRTDKAVAGQSGLKKLSQDVTEIPDTQSQSLMSQESGGSQGTCKTKGRKRGTKSVTNPASEGSNRKTRSSRSRKAKDVDNTSNMSEPLQAESKSRRGKHYSETSCAADGSESEEKNSGSKTRGKGKKAPKGSNKSSAVGEMEESEGVASKGKGGRTKKGKKEEEPIDVQDVGRSGKKSEKEANGTQTKGKCASKNIINDVSGPLMIEDNLSQDFVVPKTTVKGKLTHGVNELEEDEMTSCDLMYNPGPEEERMTSRLPQIDRRAAAQALAAENAEFCVPSSAPEERHISSQIVPNSQPKRDIFRRSGRFPSPLLSDITEESTLSKTSSGPKLGKQVPQVSSQSDEASELMVIKSRTKPETAKADSTSISCNEKDPYEFGDSSSVGSFPLGSRKTATKGGGGDGTSALKDDEKTVAAKRKKGGYPVTDCQDDRVEESSQDEFVEHSHRFGIRNNGSAKGKDQEKSQRSTKGRKTSPLSDHQQETTETEEDVHEKPRQSSRRKMKGKLDSEDAYVQRIQRETKELAEFASRMQDQEDEYPDIEVARDVSHVTEVYDDTDISTFVKSVMKSLPERRMNKDVLKKPFQGKGKTHDRQSKTLEDEVDEEPLCAEKKDPEVVDVVNCSHRRQSSSGSRKRNSKSLSRSVDAQVEEGEVTSEPHKKLPFHNDISRKEAVKPAAGKSTKSTRRYVRESVKGDESLTEGEMSVDDMVSAHMESILGDRSGSIKKSVSKKAENRIKERRVASHVEELEMDNEVLRHAEDSISRQSKMIVALQRSARNKQQDEVNNTEAEKVQRKRSGEEIPHLSNEKSKRAKRSSMSSIQGDQALHGQVLSPEYHKERQSKFKKSRLEKLDDDSMYDYERDLEELQASRKKMKQESKHQDSITKKRKDYTPKTTNDKTPSYSAKNKRSMKDIVEVDVVQSRMAKAKALTTSMNKLERSAPMSKVSKDSRAHFGSQIDDSDSEEIMETATTTPPDDMSTVVSVESFSSMCKDLLKSSRRGIASGRTRRKVQKVDYTELENSSIGSDDHSDLQTPCRSAKKTCEKSTSDIYEFREETSSCCTSFISDAISECSWLADRPKQKVSTYSKTRREVFGLAKISKNLDTVKKPRSNPQIKNANAPKKRKSKSLADDAEEELPLYYYEEEKEIKKTKKSNKKGIQQRKETDDTIQVPSHHELLSKKPKSSCRRSLVERMSSLGSSSSHMYDSSQDLRDDSDEGEEDDERNEEKEKEEEEEEEVLIPPATPALTIETVTSQLSSWTTPGSSTRTPRTPKQVSFVDELESLGSDGEGDFEMDYPVSGPSNTVRSSESTLKKKYANLLLDDEDENIDEEIDEDVSLDDDPHPELQDVSRSKDIDKNMSRLNQSSKQISMLEPRILFQGNDLMGEGEQSEHSGEDGISDHSISSSWGHNMDFHSMQMPEMFGFMRNRIKQKITEKRTQTQKFTETAIQSTQRQMNKLFLELHKARQRGQNDFQDKLLTELVGMEGSLEKLNKIQAQNEHLLKQYAKKSTQHVEQHLSRVEELHAGFLRKGASIGENVVESLQQIINKEMKTMLKKMMQDMQQEQMKKTMQSLFLMR